MIERLLTPSKITAWLECGHFLTLRNQADIGTLQIESAPHGSLADLLIEKGASHEQNCLRDFEDQGRFVYYVPGRNPDESFSAWVLRTGNPMERGYDVIYQMPFLHDGIRGIADFLVRVDDPVSGYFGYEPIDAKLTRSAGKPGHVLQLCFYADALEALSGSAPREMHLWLGTGEQESLLVEQFRPYWRRLRRQLSTLLNDEQRSVVTTPERCDHCEYCEFERHCDASWRAQDSLIYVANIRVPEKKALDNAGVHTLSELAMRDEPIDEIREEHFVRLHRQAALQLRARQSEGDAPPFELIASSEDPVFGHGFDYLPAPDLGDVFFDFEGHPFWVPQYGLFFLAGLYYRDVHGDWVYDARWAHDLVQQHEMIKELVGFLDARRTAFPAMHVYHYNHTERSALEGLTRGTESEGLLNSLVQSGLFVDLFVIAKNALQVGTESYGLKYLERLTGFVRAAGIEKGAGAVIEYERFMGTHDPLILEEIARYNRDDVAATLALRGWLLEHRPDDVEWREAILEQEDPEFDTDELVARLATFEEHSGEYLLGDLLNYWRRERWANTAPKFAKAASEFASLYSEPEYITNLEFRRFEDVDSRGVPARDAVFAWPAQPVDPDFAEKKRVLFTGVGIEHEYGYLPSVDFAQRELHLRWRESYDTMGGLPSVMVLDDYVSPGSKPSVLVHLAEQVLSGGNDDPPSRVAMALLGRERPRFHDGKGPHNGVFTDETTAMLEWVGDLDESYVAIQGPPGTGKTYSGSQIIHALIKAGKRVGITAMSHGAIDNLLRATHKVFDEHGDLEHLRALRIVKKKPDDPLGLGVTYRAGIDRVESLDYNLVAGTTWLWSRAAMHPYPVDFLIIDEAGQLSLADAVATTNAARNLVLLGDPLQLSQVSQAEHPRGSGASVLEHVLGDHATIPASQGVFISVTRRMHPDVCRFISHQIYEGRLTSHESCAVQNTEFGTGLRWIEARHEGRSTESPEEAALVVEQITSMIGTTWVDQRGVVHVLRGEDFMVVAPYNDQVRLIRRNLDKTPVLTGVQVGTVDKFQGREAPVVFFTMTTSSDDEMLRGTDFLFSRNRLNVAVSRARCLAYLVCTEALLDSRARTIEDMRLISTLSAFVEYAESI